MNRCAYLLACVLSLLSLSCRATEATTKTANRKPNVILILTDDAGYGDFGFQGLDQFKTPHIDQLVSEGVLCTNGYVSASVCAPSRAGLITGRYQQRFGHEYNGPEGDPQPGYTHEHMGLDIRETTIGDVMQAQGYKTMAVGKWHLGHQKQFRPTSRGFDEFYGFWSGSRSYFPLENPGEMNAIRRGDEAISEAEEIKYTTDDLTTATLDFIQRNKDNPFFIYLAYNAVHGPMHAKEEHLKQLDYIPMRKRHIYAAMTVSLDENVGRLTQTLKNLGLEQDTLVIFINDNGGATSNGSDNAQLRGMKGSKWEGGIRVPFAVKWPGVLPAGKTYEEPIISLDLLPTSLAAAGGTWNGEKELDGVNLLPYLKGEKTDAPHEILFWRRGVAAAVRKGKWKLIRVTGNPTLLFDLEKDVSETKNLADQYPQIVNELSDALADWEKELIPPKWKEAPKWERNQVMKHRMDVNTRQLERKYP